MEIYKDDILEEIIEDKKSEKIRKIKIHDKVLFSTRLRKALIRELKILSAKSGKKIHEIVEEAIEKYISNSDY